LLDYLLLSICSQPLTVGTTRETILLLLCRIESLAYFDRTSTFAI
jgi:hypothetical protein